MPSYARLANLLGSYLHQDFLAEFPTAMGAVRAFVDGEPPESVRAAAAEIDALLADDRFREAPDASLMALGCYYAPRSEGWTPAEWLQQVQRVLRSP